MYTVACRRVLSSVRGPCREGSIHWASLLVFVKTNLQTCFKYYSLFQRGSLHENNHGSEKCWYYNNSSWSITRDKLGMSALGQLIRFMVAWTHSMFALPYMGAEALIFSLWSTLGALPPHLLLFYLSSWHETTGNEWNAADELILTTSDSIFWNREVGEVGDGCHIFLFLIL
jgi:hypothetical protein